MKIEICSISKIKPYEQNPRINDGAVEAVAESIREFGWRQAIVVDEAGVIIAGHTRWKAALKLGLAEVPVHVATDLTPAQVKAYRIADNKTGELAEWDFKLLPFELKDLQGMDYDIEKIGFGKEELEKLVSSDILKNENPEAIISNNFIVMIDCPDEITQTKLLEKLIMEGHKCRALIS